jgi:4'-phosphopantetheinyl transferase
MIAKRISIGQLWKQPSTHLVLSENEVHVWAASLEHDNATIQRFSRVLSLDERDRAGMLHRARESNHFIAARGILRHILSHYLDTKPRELAFTYSEYGKMALKIPGRQASIQFSVSHSNEVALYALARDRNVGTDIEQVRADIAYERIARKLFAPEEIAALAAMPESTRLDAFFAYWTCKEAFVKAIGEGVSYRFDQFVVSAEPGEAPKLLAVKGEPQATSQWFFHRIIPATGYIGMLAVDGPALPVLYQVN